MFDVMAMVKVLVESLSASRQGVLLEHFARNIKAAQSYQPNLFEKLETVDLEHLARCRITESAQFGLVLEEKRNGQWVTLTSEMGAKQRAIANRQHNDTYGFFCFIGIGFGEEMADWFDYTLSNPPTRRMPNFMPPITLIEPSIVYLCLFFLTGDRVRLLAADRVSWFVGASAVDDAFRHWTTSGEGAAVSLFRYSFALDRIAFMQAVDEAIQASYLFYHQHGNQLLSELNAYYNASHIQSVMEKLQTGQATQLKVMGITSRFTTYIRYATRDLLAGFAALGAQVTLYEESADHVVTTEYHKVKAVYEYLPDIIFTIDYLRFPFLPKNIPLITWIQDDLPHLVLPKSETASLTDYDFVYVFAQLWQKRYQQRAFYKDHPIGLLPLGFNPCVYYPLADAKQDIDVLYVTHLLAPENTLWPYRKMGINANLTPAEQTWLQMGGSSALLQQVHAFLTRTLDAMTLQQLANLSGNDLSREAWLVDELTALSLLDVPGLLILLSEKDGHRGRIGNDLLTQLKLRPLRALAQSKPERLAIYGNNWQNYPDVAAYAKGAAGNGEMLNALQSRAKICINNSPEVSFHMRSVEIMASGAFMLSRRIPLEADLMPITQLFEEGTEVVLFDDEQGLVEQVTFFLEKNTARQEIARAAYSKLQQHHSYRQRAQQLLTDIEQRFKTT